MAAFWSFLKKRHIFPTSLCR